jgi:hypothetical protein
VTPNPLDVVGRIHHVQNVLLARANAPVNDAQILMNNADIAHGVLMGIAIVLSFPIGALVTRLSKSRHMVWIHVGCQISGLVILLGGFGTGIWTSIIHDEVNSHYDLLRATINFIYAMYISS